MNTSDLLSLTWPQLLSLKLNEVTNEDPLRYINDEFKHINPGMLVDAIDTGKAEFLNLNKKNAKKKLNCYLTLGGDGFNESFFNGAIATLLWLNEYLEEAKDKFNITDDELDTTKSVLSHIGLPKITDISREGASVKAISTCKHYASFLGSLTHWCTSGSASVKTNGPSHTNMEVVRLLSHTALNTFPSVPFAAYFIGQIRNDDILACAEHMSSVVNFGKYMSPECIAINQPAFIIQTDNAPIVGIVGHPLVNTVIGQSSHNNNIEWLGLFETTHEFEKLCINNGFTSQDVKKYLLTTDMSTHKRNLESKHKLACFVEDQHITKQALEMHASMLVA